MNRFKLKKEETSKAMEAVEYVCETLNFSNITEVLHYFMSVKKVEMRIKNMISMRKHLIEIVQKNLESVTQVKMESTNCLPAAILQLDVNIEHVQREGLDVQKKQFEDVNKDITTYGILFNELWFQLDSLVGKLERCHVRVHIANNIYCSAQSCFVVIKMYMYGYSSIIRQINNCIYQPLRSI